MEKQPDRVRFILDNHYYSIEVTDMSAELMTQTLKDQFGTAVEIVTIPAEATYDGEDGA